jgi:hypothetical protein
MLVKIMGDFDKLLLLYCETVYSISSCLHNLLYDTFELIHQSIVLLLDQVAELFNADLFYNRLKQSCNVSISYLHDSSSL